MMTLKKYLLLVLAVGYSFNACDVIEEPFLVEKEVVSDSCEAFIFPTQEIYVKKVSVNLKLNILLTETHF